MFEIKESGDRELAGVIINTHTKLPIFFTEDEAEYIRRFLNNRTVGIRKQILFALEDLGNLTLGEIVSCVNFSILSVEKELAAMEMDRLVIQEGTKVVEHWDVGEVKIPVWRLVIDKGENLPDKNLFKYN